MPGLGRTLSFILTADFSVSVVMRGATSGVRDCQGRCPKDTVIPSSTKQGILCPASPLLSSYIWDHFPTYDLGLLFSHRQMIPDINKKWRLERDPRPESAIHKRETQVKWHHEERLLGNPEHSTKKLVLFSQAGSGAGLDSHRLEA